MATVWLNCCASLSLQPDRESSSSVLSKAIARCSAKVENVTTEAHMRTLSALNSAVPRASSMQSLHLKWGFCAHLQVLRGQNFTQLGRCLWLSQVYAQGQHWDLGRNLIGSNSCRQPKMELSSRSGHIFHSCGAHSLFRYCSMEANKSLAWTQCGQTHIQADIQPFAPCHMWFREKLHLVQFLASLV